MRLDGKSAIMTDGAATTIGEIHIKSMRTILLITTVLTVLMMLWPSDVYAAGGIGFAQAEEGTWYCRGDDPIATLNCAQRKCGVDAKGRECVRTRWCDAAGWSGLMTVFLLDFHSTEIICGAPTETALRAGLRAFCAGNEYAQSCSIFLVVDPDGKERELTDESFPGPKAN